MKGDVREQPSLRGSFLCTWAMWLGSSSSLSCHGMGYFVDFMFAFFLLSFFGYICFWFQGGMLQSGDESSCDRGPGVRWIFHTLGSWNQRNRQCLTCWSLFWWFMDANHKGQQGRSATYEYTWPGIWIYHKPQHSYILTPLSHWCNHIKRPRHNINACLPTDRVALGKN